MQIMNPISTRLSVEELALIFSLLHKPETGADLLKAQLGSHLTSRQVQERLVAASHTLIAQGYAAVDLNGSIHLTDEILYVGHLLIRPDYSVRLMRSHKVGEFVLTYHIKDHRIFEHQIDQGVVHGITEIPENEVIARRVTSFFGISVSDELAETKFRVHLDVLKSIGTPEARDIASLVQDDGQANSVREFRRDAIDPEYKGSMLRIEYDENNTPTSDEGILVLKGSHACWVLSPSQDSSRPWVDISLCTTKSLTEHLVNMLPK